MTERLLELFQSKYSREVWQITLLEVFGVREISPNPTLIEDNEKASCFELGRHQTEDGYDIGVFEYAMKEGFKVEKSRVGLRNLVSEFLRYHVDAALVVFHDSEHWRLSFICDLKGEKTEPKRFTYVFGYHDQIYRTPIERFRILSESKQTFTNIREAFSVDKLDKDFFKGYKQLYEMFCGYMPDGREYRNFIKKMMGRMVFLHFLQKKGWLGGDRDFLNNLLKRSTHQYKDTFLSQVLSILFFETLNKQREANTVDPILGEGIQIPYMNGGLFERDELDRDGVDFPFECFEKLFGFLSSYNFTIDENDPHDSEVGVDPEMLGHIFENLLEDNKDKGAYYTPKAVVQYMCRDAIFEYLKTRTDEPLHENFRKMVYDGDFEWLKDCPTAKEIIGHVRNVKVCDPAIGSGVFPMMMLNELYNIRRGFYDCFDNQYPVTPYRLKKDILQNNLYGVDLDQGAVDIARLRFWLALVVDDTEQRPLPNLDYKIMQGNSLLESYRGIELSLYYEDENGNFLHTDKGKSKIGLVNEYFGESDKEQKTLLRKEIDKRVDHHIWFWNQARPYIIEDIKNIDPTNKPFFLWHIYFHHILKQGGFDIVIGNPPYGATTSQTEKRMLKREYRTTWTRHDRYAQKGSMDTYSIFIEQGYNLLKEKGYLSFIVPMSVTSSDSMTGVHNLLLNNCKSIKISSYAENPKPVFDNAKLATSILSFNKTKTNCEEILVTKMHRRKSEVSLEKLLMNQEYVEAGEYMLRGRYPKIGKEIEKKILSKLFEISSSIGKFIQEKGQPIFYRMAGGGYYRVITNYSTGSTAEKTLFFDAHISNLIGAILSTSFFFWYYQVYGDNHNLKFYEIESFPLPIEGFDNDLITEISNCYGVYLSDIENNARIIKTKGYKNIDRFKEYKIWKSKHLIDKLDDLICPVYGLAKHEIDFIKNYEIEFRIQGDI